MQNDNDINHLPHNYPHVHARACTYARGREAYWPTLTILI